MRVQSDHPSKDGGWYHEIYGTKKVFVAPKGTVKKVELDFDKMIQVEICHQPKESFAKGIGVNVESLNALGFSYSLNRSEWAWRVPMRDGENKIIGIHLRCDDGTKKAVVGSRNGLFLPQGIEPQRIAYICEGASNCAALLTMGFYAIGRPSCSSGGEMLKIALKCLGVRNLVVIADNDCLKPAGNRPGQDGAKKLKKELGLMSVIWTPPSPCKDVRELLNKVGIESTKALINAGVEMKIWTKV